MLTSREKSPIQEKFSSEFSEVNLKTLPPGKGGVESVSEETDFQFCFVYIGITVKHLCMYCQLSWTSVYNFPLFFYMPAPSTAADRATWRSLAAASHARWGQRGMNE